MFHLHCTERLPSRILLQSTNVASALHPDPLSCSAYWSNCTITRNVDLIFKRGSGELAHFKVPGACEKANNPNFFRLPCVNAADVLGGSIEAGWVMNYDFSEGTSSSEKQKDHACLTLRQLPTVAMLLRTASTDIKLLIVRPVLKAVKEEPTIVYHATLLTPPEGVRHVVLGRDGSLLLLLGHHIPDHDFTVPCFSYAVKGDHGCASFKPTRLCIPSPFVDMLREESAQRVVCARARKALRQVESPVLGGLDTEVILLTDHAVVLIFHVNVSREAETSCVWAVCLPQQCGMLGGLQNPLGVIERGKASTSIRQAVDFSSGVPTSSLGANILPYLPRCNVASPVVCMSPNGSLMLVVAEGLMSAFIVGLGSNINACTTTTSVTHVPLPPNLVLCDVSWMGKSLCGFLLLGKDKRSGVTALYFLPLTGQPPQRILIDETHSPLSGGEQSRVNFFSVLSETSNRLGSSELQISLLFSNPLGGGGTTGARDKKSEKGGILRSYLLSTPTTTCLSLDDPSNVARLIRYTGLTFFNVDSGSACDTSGSLFIDDAAGFGGLRPSMEVKLEWQLDPWFGLGDVSNESSLSGILHEVIHYLKVKMQRCRFIKRGGDSCDAVSGLVSIVQGVADAFLILAIPSSPEAIRRHLKDIHSILVVLREALMIMGQYGAISGCFSAAAPLAKLNDAKYGTVACSEWRTLVGVFFDDVLACTHTCPSLSRTLIPHCSAAVQQIMSSGEHIQLWMRKQHQTAVTDAGTLGINGNVDRSLNQVLSIIREEPSKISMLSPADICCTSRRLFFSDGIDATCAFVKTVSESNRLNSVDVRNICGDYDTVKNNMGIVLRCI